MNEPLNLKLSIYIYLSCNACGYQSTLASRDRKLHHPSNKQAIMRRNLSLLWNNIFVNKTKSDNYEFYDACMMIEELMRWYVAEANEVSVGFFLWKLISGPYLQFCSCLVFFKLKSIFQILMVGSMKLIEFLTIWKSRWIFLTIHSLKME